MALTSPTALPDDAVTQAAAAISEAHYRGVDGQAVRQKTAADVIHRHLRLLDAKPGMRVMEIGTGSGLSAALLSELVGPTGHVVSLDLDRDLTNRAKQLHTEAGRTNITTVAVDGRHGYPDQAPYDRVIAWTTPPVLLRTWVEQTRPGGIIVQPVPVSSLVYSTAMARFTAGVDKTPTDVSLYRGAYVLMDTTEHQAREIDRADAQLHRDGDNHASYVSAPWLHDNPAAETVLRRLMDAKRIEASDLTWPDSEHFKTWLIARAPDRVVATGRNTQIGIGIADASHIAYVEIYGDGDIYADSTNSPMLKRLRQLLAEWQQTGRPEISALPTTLTPGANGWQVRLAPIVEDL